MRKDCSAPDYFCTWLVQGRNYAQKNYPYPSLIDAWCRFAADMIDENNLFGAAGWATAYPEKMRQQLIFLLDSGWDVPYGTPNADSLSFGSMLPDPQRFPSTANLHGAEKLKWIAEKIRALGWKGTGIWIPAHEVGSVLTGDEAEKYWIEKLQQSKEAGICYWKIDWGEKMLDVEFRKMLTRLGHHYHPELWIEHALVPTGQTNDGKRTGRFAEPHKLLAACQELEFADVFRTYDCTWSLANTVTIARVAEIMLAFADRKCSGAGYLNLESNPYLALALGSTFGAMCPPDTQILPDELGLRDDSMSNARLGLDEVVNAIKCRRDFVPAALSLDAVENHVSGQWLTDEYSFTEIYGEEAGVNHIKVPQALTRGLPLPEIRDLGEGTPLFAATYYPEQDTLVAAILPRAVNGVVVMPLCDIKISMAAMPGNILIFGNAQRINFCFDNKAEAGSYTVAAVEAQNSEETFTLCGNGDGIILEKKHIAALNQNAAQHLPATLMRRIRTSA